jgi:hypothetical protein
MSEHILFYSKRCPNCDKLFSLMSRSPRVQGQFLFVCIDDRRFKVPKCIRSVPSAIIPTPSGQPQVFSGTNLFNWVKKRLPSQGPPGLPGGGGGGGAGGGAGGRSPTVRRPTGTGQGRRDGGRGGGGGQGTGAEGTGPEEWDAFVMNNLSGAFSYLDESKNETLVEKTQALLRNIEHMHIHTVDDDGDGGKPNITAVSYDPSSAGAPAQGGGGGGGGGRPNPFAQQRQRQNYSQHEEEQEEYQAPMADHSMFRDQGYEGGSDTRRSARKNDFDAKMEEMKRNRDFGMPQPIRRM